MFTGCPFQNGPCQTHSSLRCGYSELTLQFIQQTFRFSTETLIFSFPGGWYRNAENSIVHLHLQGRGSQFSPTSTRHWGDSTNDSLTPFNSLMSMLWLLFVLDDQGNCCHRFCCAFYSPFYLLGRLGRTFTKILVSVVLALYRLCRVPNKSTLRKMILHKPRSPKHPQVPQVTTCYYTPHISFVLQLNDTQRINMARYFTHREEDFSNLQTPASIVWPIQTFSETEGATSCSLASPPCHD